MAASTAPELVEELLASTSALGVWLLRPMVVVNNRHENQVVAGAVRTPTIDRPTRVLIAGETYLDLGDRQVFADLVGKATLVILFDERTSLGLIRLRARDAKVALGAFVSG